MRIGKRWKTCNALLMAAIVIGWCGAGPASAAPTYSYVVDQNSITLLPGQTATVDIFLLETLPSGTSLISSDGGLLGAGARVTQSATGLPAHPSTITGFTLASPTPGTLAAGQGTGGFDGPASGSITGGTNFEFVEDASSTNVGLGNTGNSITAPANEVYLATMQITGGSSLGTTKFLLGEHDSSGPHNETDTANSLFDLDVTNNTANGGGATYTGVGATTSSITVTVATPEPGSLGLLGFSALLLLRRRRFAGNR